MTATHRPLSAALWVAAALALLPLLAGGALWSLGGSALPPLGLPLPLPVGTPLPGGAPAAPGTAGPLPAAGVGLPLAMLTKCSRYAAPWGSDRARGVPAAPFRTVQRLVRSLRPGQTGCLRAGSYAGPVSIARGGRPGARITLAAYPGETATIVGRLEIVEGANYVTVNGLRLDGANPHRLPSPMVDANHVTFSYDDVTNDHTGICFGIGSATWGWAIGTLITHDRVYDCGELPATNAQHGLYIGAATDTTIEWSLIYGNADRGIQLYPDAQRTTIDHNIIDDNGEGIIISGAGGVASSYTNIYDNILSNADIRHDVESYWPPGNPLGVDNTVHNNCIWGGSKGGIGMADGGYRVSENLKASPQFVNEVAHDYEMSPTSSCLALVGDVQAAVDGTAPVQPPAGGTPPMSPPPTTSGSGSGGTTGHGSANVPARKTSKRKATLKRKRVAHAAKRHKEKRRKRRKAKPHTIRR